MSARLVWASHSTSLGGAERALAELLTVAIQAEMVHRALVVVPSSTGPLLERLPTERVDVVTAPMAAWMTLEPRGTVRAWRRHVKNLWVARQLSGTLDAFQPDLAVTNTLTIPSLALASRSAGIRHRWFAHEPGTRHHLHLGQRTWDTIRSTGDRLIVPSKSLARDLGSRLRQDTTVVAPIVLRGDAPASPSRDPRRILFVGDANPSKGLTDAIRAAAEASRRGAGLRLAVVGAGRDTATVHRLLDEAGLLDCEVVPTTSEISEQYLRSSVVMCPSRSETFGRIPAEALWHGCQVIVNDLPVWREWLPDTPAVARMVTNDPAAVAARLVEMVERPPPTGAIAAARRRLADQFGPDTAAVALRRALGP